MAYFTNRQAPQSGIANLLAMKGRMGDTELVHMSKPEINMLRSMGKLTSNPMTGLPEAFNLEEAMSGLAGLMNQDLSGKEAMQELMNFGRNKIAQYNEPPIPEPTMPVEPQVPMQGMIPNQPMQMPTQQPLNEENFSGQGGIAALAGGKRPFEGMLDVKRSGGSMDGMSDDILFKVKGDPVIDKALLSRDEYVIPADVVSNLGNGSSDAGAEKLDKFLGDVREESTGTRKQIKEIDGEKMLRELA
jgi:hypothetical protein